jgi:hypothetical protein
VPFISACLKCDSVGEGFTAEDIGSNPKEHYEKIDFGRVRGTFPGDSEVSAGSVPVDAAIFLRRFGTYEPPCLPNDHGAGFAKENQCPSPPELIAGKISGSLPSGILWIN